jgi:hypothetical protein
MWGKLTLSAACVGFLAGGCGSGGNDQTPHEVATGFVAAWNRHDAAAVCAYYTDASRKLYAQGAATLATRGPNTCAGFISQTQFSGDSRARWQVTDVVVHGDQAVVTVDPKNRHTPFVSLGVSLVKVGDSWRVGGNTLSDLPGHH